MAETFRWEFDPQQVDASIRRLTEQAQALYEQARYTKVRISYGGKPIFPDLPIATVLAAEALSFAFAGPLRVVVINLGMRAFLDVEFIHDASEKIREGQTRMAEGDVESAEALYREALAMKPGDCAANYHLGVLLRVTGRREEAVAAFEAAAAVAGAPEADKARDALDKMRRGKSL